MTIDILKLKRVQWLLALVVSFSACNVVQANADDYSQFELTPAAVHYENALGLIQAQAYPEALKLLRTIHSAYPGYEKLPDVQTRIAVLKKSNEASAEIGHYLTALDQRDAGDNVGAMNSLDQMMSDYQDSVLTDDALYLKAYIQVMDSYDFSDAQDTLFELQFRFPGSSYQDSAAYLNAIAYEQMGQTDDAQQALEDLRDRHTAFKLPFGYSMPSGNVLSRYWYDRANNRLAIIEQASASASLMRSKQTLDSGDLNVRVTVDGAELELQLSASPMMRETQWRDGSQQSKTPPTAGVFVGTVAGDEDSWVRAVVVDETISGIAHAYGRDYTMESGTLIGTLDYYQPRSARDRANGAADSSSKELEVGHDGLVPPPALGAAFGGTPAAANTSDLRVVPLSIVVDDEFDRYHSGHGLVVALNQLNVADGIYRQFGLAFAVDEVQTFGASDHNPLKNTAGTLESYLVDFRNYRQTNRSFFDDSVLTYLFTGKKRTDSTLGLAWIDTLCRTDGYDVGVTTPSAIGEVLLTHELGHSLGSQHDSDTSCNRDATKIMWPNISSRTQPEFSACSQQSVSHAHYKSCLLNSVDVSLNAIGTDSGVEFVVGNLDTSVSVETTLTIETSSAGLLNLPASCHELSPTTASCALGEVGAGQEQRLALSVSAAASDVANALVTAEVTTVESTDYTTSNNIASYSIDMQSISSDHLILASNTSDDIGGLNATSPTPETSAAGGSVSKVGLLMLSLVHFISAIRLKRTD